ncbi:MAG: potassium channel family protein [Kiloniellales bacterium]|nr:potassium channel family protein [Kiloniellales bacterium]MDJ0981550.1 potassium channel family protein [Kiloniellales bacterium]
MELQAGSIYRSGSLQLLVALVLLIILSSLLEGTQFGQRAVDILFALVILATVRAASSERRTRVVFLVLAVSAIALLWTSNGVERTVVGVAGLMIFVVLNVGTVGLMLKRILQAQVVDFDVLCSAVAVYLLIGVTWALTYIAIDILDPTAFEQLAVSAWDGGTDYVYFSFVTLTTLGYGDISPNGNFVRIWAVMEAGVGVLYLALLIARLVSLYRP